MLLSVKNKRYILGKEEVGNALKQSNSDISINKNYSKYNLHYIDKWHIWYYNFHENNIRDERERVIYHEKNK